MVLARPLELESRAAKSLTCTKSSAPCVCNNSVGIRSTSKLNCPSTTFAFKDPASPSDGTIKEFKTKPARVSTQCDHIVELQYIASKFTPAICTELNKNGQKNMTSFVKFINDQPRLVNVVSTVNNAKGVKFKSPPGKFRKTSKKAAFGAASYLGLIRSDAQAIANDIDKKMNDFLRGSGVAGFKDFEKDYTKKLDDAVTACKKEAPSLDDLNTKAAKKSAAAAKKAQKKTAAASTPATKPKPKTKVIPPVAGKKRPASGGKASPAKKRP
ncbi:hypothetical protein VNI00_006487 [Paramarasmius palmivorus]|uniref:Uncharacterized protein n=1 Tax=Paramarasmius palmivorus TaxID=297713 RepID=A0AAW0D8Y0_9AGAR